MILGFKKKFDDGQPTFFSAKIIDGLKIHTLRSGFRWRAGLDIQMAHGVRTNHYEQFNKNIPKLQKCISVQDVFMTFNGWEIEITVDNRNYLSDSEIDKLIKNDGLTDEQFFEWFFPGKQDEWSGQIIHWTNFKY